MESPIHRALSIDYGIVVEGAFELTLDSGEKKLMLPGDMSKSLLTLSINSNSILWLTQLGVNRGCMHMWKNLDENRPGRMLFVLLDVTPTKVNGEEITEHLGILEKDYADVKQ